MSRKKKGSVKDTDTILVTSVDLSSSDVTSVLGVGNGGNGTGTFTDGQILIGQTSGNTLAKRTLSGAVSMDKDGVTSIATSSGVQQWVTYTFNYTDTSAAGTTKTITVLTLPTNGVLLSFAIRQHTAYSGGSLSNVTVQLLVNGSSVTTELSMMTNDRYANNNLFWADTGITNDIQILVTSYGDNLNAATAGVMLISLLTATVP